MVNRTGLREEIFLQLDLYVNQSYFQIIIIKIPPQGSSNAATGMRIRINDEDRRLGSVDAGHFGAVFGFLPNGHDR